MLVAVAVIIAVITAVITAISASDACQIGRAVWKWCGFFFHNVML